VPEQEDLMRSLDRLVTAVEGIEKQQQELKDQQAALSTTLTTFTLKFASLEQSFNMMADQTLPPMKTGVSRNKSDITDLRALVADAMNKAEHLEDHYTRTSESVVNLTTQVTEVKSYIWKAMGVISAVVFFVSLFASPLLKSALGDSPKTRPIEITLVQKDASSPHVVTSPSSSPRSITAQP